MIQIKDIYGKVIYNYNGTSLKCANLRGLDLREADFGSMDLSRADFKGTDLFRANFHMATLYYTYFNEANLSGANFIKANLSNADFNGAKLDNIKYDETTSFFALQCPEEGSFIGYKKVFVDEETDYIIKLEVPEDAKRSSSTSRKCRCDKAKVLGIYDIHKNLLDVRSFTNYHYVPTEYTVGEMVYADSWDENRWNECSHGIHFFITFKEAVNY